MNNIAIIESEYNIIGSLIGSPEYILTASKILKQEHFSSIECGLIFSELVVMSSTNSPIDLRTVIQRRKLQKIQPATTASLTNYASFSIEQVISSCRFIFEKWTEKKAKTITNKFSLDPGVDIFESINKVISELNSLSNIQSETIASVSELAMKEKHCYDEHKAGRLLNSRIKTDWLNYSKHIHHPVAQITLIAARPAMGKTAFAMSLALEVLECGHPVLFFSLEMTKERIFKRIMANRMDVELSDVQEYNYNIESLAELHQQYSDSIFEIDDQSGLDENQINSKILQFQHKHNLVGEEKYPVIIIDYLQITKCSDSRKDNNDNSKYAHIMKSFQVSSKSMNVHFVVLSQLNREVEKRPGSMPQLSDIRASGAIEEVCDTIYFLYRPEYYGITEDGEGNPVANKILAKIAKNRDGLLGDILFSHELNKMQIYEGERTPDMDIDIPKRIEMKDDSHFSNDIDLLEDEDIPEINSDNPF